MTILLPVIQKKAMLAAALLHIVQICFEILKKTLVLRMTSCVARIFFLEVVTVRFS